jgi:hypothetical protein
MATTLTLAHIRSNGVYVAWVGDSRIYQFRGSKILFKTKDHSWVNEALDAGIITPQEAVGHPKSNIITRAVQGSHKPARVDDRMITDLRPDDCFLLCSDGVLETWSDDDFSALFGSGKPVEEIIHTIQSECVGNSKDNSTAIVFKIGAVTSSVQTTNSDARQGQVDEIPMVEAIPLSENQVYDPERTTARFQEREFSAPRHHFNTPSKRRSSMLGLVGVAAIVILGLYFNFKGDGNNLEKPKSEKTQVVKKPDLGAVKEDNLATNVDSLKSSVETINPKETDDKKNKDKPKNNKNSDNNQPQLPTPAGSNPTITTPPTSPTSTNNKKPSAN